MGRPPHARICRSSYGRVLATGGDWAAAEVELTGAIEDLEAARPGLAAGGVARLGELRARQGRIEEARILFERAGGHRLAQLGLGSLALGAGDAQAAADVAERVLRRLPADSALDRLGALELLVEARSELGELDEATAACAELAAIGEAIATPHVAGKVQLARARVALARGADDEARRACEDARDRFGEASDRFEVARAKLALAHALAAMGRERAATAEAEAAREEFAALGAAPQLALAEALESRRGGGAQPGELSARELEILRLVADGLSDREIADRLILSPHTVHRHVANVRKKLRQPSRAAAVALRGSHRSALSPPRRWPLSANSREWPQRGKSERPSDLGSARSMTRREAR